MIRVTGYNPQSKSKMSKSKTNFGIGVNPAKASREVCPLLTGKFAGDILVKAEKTVVAEKPVRPHYMGGVPKEVKNPDAYKTGPFYWD